MEGRGCRREVPGLTLVLFLGQKKASSCLAAVVPEQRCPASESPRAWGGRPPTARPGSRGPFTNACCRARRPVCALPPLRWPPAVPSERGLSAPKLTAARKESATRNGMLANKGIKGASHPQQHFPLPLPQLPLPLTTEKGKKVPDQDAALLKQGRVSRAGC